MENGLFQLGKVLVSTFVATYGTMQIAANGVTNSLSTLCYVTEMAMQLAVVTLVGQCVGANDYEQAKYYIRKMFIIGYGLAIVDNLLLFVLSPYALKLYPSCMYLHLYFHPAQERQGTQNIPCMSVLSVCSWQESSVPTCLEQSLAWA